MIDKTKPRLDFSHLSRRDFLGLGIPTLATLLAACSPVGRQLVSTLTPSRLPPTPIPSATPIQPATETSTATAISLETLLPPNILSQSTEQGAQYSLESNKVFIDVDGNQVEIDPAQITLNFDRSGQTFVNENSLYPNIISVKVGDQTYAYDADYKGWFATYEGSIDVQKPTTVPYESTSDGRVLISLLLDHDVNVPFPEGTLYQGDSVDLQWGPSASYVYLRNRGAYNPTSTINNVDVRWIDRFFQTTVPKGTLLTDGTALKQDLTLHFQPTKWLDDPQNQAKPDLSKFKLLMMASGPERSDSGQLGLGQSLIKDKLAGPDPLLTVTGKYLTTGDFFPDSLTSQPSIATIYNLPGNGLDQMDYLGFNINHKLMDLNSTNMILEFPAVNGIPDSMQKMLLPFYYGIWSGSK